MANAFVGTGRWVRKNLSEKGRSGLETRPTREQRRRSCELWLPGMVVEGRARTQGLLHVFAFFLSLVQHPNKRTQGHVSWCVYNSKGGRWGPGNSTVPRATSLPGRASHNSVLTLFSQSEPERGGGCCVARPPRPIRVGNRKQNITKQTKKPTTKAKLSQGWGRIKRS